jgi:FtsP/CotA-like multicopper oxidase with cupredoxin domain
MILKDMTIVSGAPAPHAMMRDYMHGLEGSAVMVNGQVNPRLTIKKGQVQRWRILNASSARFYKLALDGHQMHLIGTDGGLLDKPYPVSELLLSPGERVDVLVRAAQSSGSYRLKALPYARMGMSTLQTITLMTLTYSGTGSQSLPTQINPDAKRVDPMSLGGMLMEHSLTLSMGQGNGYINGQDFDTNPYTIMSQVGSWEIWTITNDSGMDHPFHQHVNPGQVLAVTGGDAKYAALHTSIPAWKDTVLVPKWGSVKLLIPIMDYTGMAMFHCHILEHEDIGMMGMWHLMGDMGDDM